MRVVVKSAPPISVPLEQNPFLPWYSEAIGEVFEVELKTHPTFGYLFYQLTDSDQNRAFFEKNEEDPSLSLLVLKTGGFGISHDNADLVETKKTLP